MSQGSGPSAIAIEHSRECDSAVRLSRYRVAVAKPRHVCRDLAQAAALPGRGVSGCCGDSAAGPRLCAVADEVCTAASRPLLPSPGHRAVPLTRRFSWRTVQEVRTEYGA